MVLSFNIASWGVRFDSIITLSIYYPHEAPLTLPSTAYGKDLMCFFEADSHSYSLRFPLATKTNVFSKA